MQHSESYTACSRGVEAPWLWRAARRLPFDGCFPQSPLVRPRTLKSSNQAVGTSASGRSAPSPLNHPMMVLYDLNPVPDANSKLTAWF
jgi:hypothetical protein